MGRTVKHFSRYRVAGTELQVVADAPLETAALVDAEKSVIKGYSRCRMWRHRRVTLFVLQGLQPLIRQLREVTDVPAEPANALADRPMVNVYDLADPTGCHLFINRQAMQEQGDWEDPVALEGLLAHEHAHPLAENGTTRSSRSLHLELVVGEPAGAREPGGRDDRPGKEERWDGVRRELAVLADHLCLHAAQEIFANEAAIRAGFGAALLHLDRQAVEAMRRSVEGRDGLLRQLADTVAAGGIAGEDQSPLLLLADFRACLDFALEVAPFLRVGREGAAAELEAVLDADIFPRLEAEAAQTYRALRDRYRALSSDLGADALAAWARDVLNLVTAPLAARGLPVRYRLRVGAPAEGAGDGKAGAPAAGMRAPMHPSRTEEGRL